MVLPMGTSLEGEQDEQDEGQEGEQGEVDGEDNRKHVHSQKNVVNYFFTNFPSDCTEVVLRNLFSDLGELADVYVARKVSKGGKRFGFVRFFLVTDHQELEDRLNQVRIGRFKLSANLAKYERSSKGEHQGRKPRNQVPLVDLSPLIIQKEWQQNVLVGEANSIHSLLDLQTLCQSVESNNCRFKYLGGLRALLEFKNKKEATDFLLNKNDYWSNWLKWLKNWSFDHKLEDRITWLCIEGLPIQVWCSEAFSQIASIWGTMLIPEECATDDTNLIYGKVCIITKEKLHINQVIDVKVDGSTSKIRISESTGELDLFFGFQKADLVSSFNVDKEIDMVKGIHSCEGRPNSSDCANSAPNGMLSDQKKEVSSSGAGETMGIEACKESHGSVKTHEKRRVTPDIDDYPLAVKKVARSKKKVARSKKNELKTTKIIGCTDRLSRFKNWPVAINPLKQ